jgi:ribosomal protein S10
MAVCNVTVSSKNKQSLFNFLIFVQTILNDSLIHKIRKKNNKKKVITVLKSPHVNKSAQEQFEFRIFSVQFSLFFYGFSTDIVVLKNIKAKLFPDVKLKLKFFLTNKNIWKTKIKLFEFNNWSINTLGLEYSTQLLSSRKLKKSQKTLYLTKRNELTKKTMNFLRLLDCYGELNLNNEENVA